MAPSVAQRRSVVVVWQVSRARQWQGEGAGGRGTVLDSLGEEGRATWHKRALWGGQIGSGGRYLKIQRRGKVDAPEWLQQGGVVDNIGKI